MFFMETVFQQAPRGNLIFDQVHKRLFEQEIMQNRFVKALLQEIKNQHVQARIRTLRSKFPVNKEAFKAQLGQPQITDEDIQIDD